MVYVDLNPIRAGLSETLESSDFTSIQERLRLFKGRQAKRTKQASSPWLRHLCKERELSSKSTLPLQAKSYFALVDWTGRAVRDDKKGAIPSNIHSILHRLGVREDNWVNNTQHFGSRFYRALGRINQIRALAKRTDQHWIIGFSAASCFYN